MKTPWISRKQHERELARFADHCVDLELDIARLRRERDRARARAGPPTTQDLAEALDDQAQSLRELSHEWGVDEPSLGESPPLEEHCTCPPGWQHRTPDCPFSTGSHTPRQRYG